MPNCVANSFLNSHFWMRDRTSASDSKDMMFHARHDRSFFMKNVCSVSRKHQKAGKRWCQDSAPTRCFSSPPVKSVKLETNAKGHATADATVRQGTSTELSLSAPARKNMEEPSELKISFRGWNAGGFFCKCHIVMFFGREVLLIPTAGSLYRAEKPSAF